MTSPEPGERRTTETQRAGRHLAVIVRISTREKGFIFARSLEAENPEEEYFLHISAVPVGLWPELQEGDAVTCKVADTSKGARGYDVERATGAEALAQVEEQEEHRGNR